MRNMSGYLFFLCLLLFSFIVEARVPSHFGFRYLSPYNKCLRDVKARYRAKSIISTEAEKDYGSRVPLPQISFHAPFADLPAVNSLKFTPASQKYYSSTHTVFHMGDDDAFAKTLVNLTNGLVQKYGEYQKNEKDGIEQYLWQKDKLQIELLHLQNVGNYPEHIILKYSYLPGVEMKESEKKRMEYHLNADL